MWGKRHMTDFQWNVRFFNPRLEPPPPPANDNRPLQLIALALITGMAGQLLVWCMAFLWWYGPIVVRVVPTVEAAPPSHMSEFTERNDVFYAPEWLHVPQRCDLPTSPGLACGLRRTPAEDEEYLLRRERFPTLPLMCDSLDPLGCF